jgi:hypothetical protein
MSDQLETDLLSDLLGMDLNVSQSDLLEGLITAVLPDRSLCNMLGTDHCLIC